MGVAARRKRAFLDKNPTCCFCGGERPASTQDHVPARAFFPNRTWPEGFVFPACDACNSSSRDAENLCAMMAKVIRIEPSPYSKEEFEKAVLAMKRGFPSLFGAISGGGEAASGYYARTGEPEPTSEFYLPESTVVTVPEDVHPLVEAFFLKLGLGLHYKHVGSVFPASGHYLVYWFTNKTLIEQSLPPAIGALFPNAEELKRGSTGVEHFFDYRWGENSPEGLFGSIVVFGDSFGAVVALVRSKPKSKVLPWTEFAPVTGVAVTE